MRKRNIHQCIRRGSSSKGLQSWARQEGFDIHTTCLSKLLFVVLCARVSRRQWLDFRRPFFKRLLVITLEERHGFRAQDRGLGDDRREVMHS